MRGRGKGGGGRGRGGRGDGFRDGPKLPSSLLNALGGQDAQAGSWSAGGRGRGRGRGGSRKESRKHHREELKAARLQHQKSRATSKKRARPDSDAQQPNAKRHHAAQLLLKAPKPQPAPKQPRDTVQQGAQRESSKDKQQRAGAPLMTFL